MIYNKYALIIKIAENNLNFIFILDLEYLQEATIYNNRPSTLPRARREAKLQKRLRKALKWYSITIRQRENNYTATVLRLDKKVKGRTLIPPCPGYRYIVILWGPYSSWMWIFPLRSSSWALLIVWLDIEGLGVMAALPRGGTEPVIAWWKGRFIWWRRCYQYQMPRTEVGFHWNGKINGEGGFSLIWRK